MISVGRSLSLPGGQARLGNPFDDVNLARLKPRRNHLSFKMDRKIATSSSSSSFSPPVSQEKPPTTLVTSTDRIGKEIVIGIGLGSSLLSVRLVRNILALVQALVFLLLAPFHHNSHVLVDKKVVAQKRRLLLEKDVLARRAMAIRRVGSDYDEDGVDENGRKSSREFSLFVTERGDTLFTQSWSPVTAPPRGVVVILHGLNEHSSRYNRFAKQLTTKGFKVYGMDWIGHGGSDGLHGYVPSLDYAVDDMKAYLLEVLARNPGLPCFCFGHSTGGAIVLKAVLDPKIETSVKGVVVTSPAIRVEPTYPLIAILAPILSLIVPRYQFSDEDKKTVPVSRDPNALVTKYSDPLVFTGSIRVRTGCEILRITSHLQQNLSRINIPFLVLHGTSDTVTDPKASKQLHEEASFADKSIKLYEGYLHDLLFEPERDDISKDIIDWLSSRVG